MWPFKRDKQTKQAEVRGVEAVTVAKERSAKASELRLARKLNQMLKSLQEAPIDIGLERIGRDVRGES